MGRRWSCARFAALAAVAAVASTARAQQVPVRIHPLGGSERDAPAIADAQALLESAVPSAARRSERLVAAKPLVTPPRCAPALAADCLARLAQDGIVVTGTVRMSGGVMVVALRAVNGAGRVVGQLDVGVDAFVQSAEPLARALLVIEARLPTSLPGATPEATVRSEPPASRAQRPEPGRGDAMTDPALRPDPPRADSTVRYKEPKPVPGTGRLTAGKWTTGVGVALLAGGTAVALLNRSRAQDLAGRYESNSLTPGDASKYRAVETYGVVATALLVGGGAATVTGLVLWGTAPDPDPGPRRGGATLGLQGRF
jgi:hypothetical protein